MSSIDANKKSREFLSVILFLQLVMSIATFLDMTVARQVIGFIYLTFIPGITLIKLLKIKIEDLAETILFAVGLSVASLMLIGFLINELTPLFGIQRPLSFIFLFPAINVFVLVCGVVAYLRGRNDSALSYEFKVENSLTAFLLLCIPILSVIGSITSGAYGDNRILLFTLIIIGTVFVVSVVSRKAVSSKLYPLVVFIIALSLVYHASLISDKLVHFGSDFPGEIFVQKIVERDGYWNPVGPYPSDLSVGRSYAMLSVTLLPTIYSIFLNLDSILVFKLFYSLLFAFVPVGLYVLWKNFVNEKFAFISAFLFASFQPFYGELLGLNKQMVGELFLVLLLIALLIKGKDKVARTVCLILFSFGLIVSHYGLAEIFLLFLTSVWILSLIIRGSSKSITSSFVILFFVLTFTWYIFTSSSTVYSAFLHFAQSVYDKMGDIFNLRLREPEILRGLGIEQPPTIWNMISRVFAYATEFFILIGFIQLVMKGRTKNRFGKEFSLFILIAMLFLFALILVPGLSGIMGMTRFYNVLLLFVAPLCAIGADAIIKLIFKHQGESNKTLTLILVVLMGYFLFQTGFVYEVTESYSWSVPLSKHRMDLGRLYREFGYINAYSISGAQWLSNKTNVLTTTIYADRYSRLNELRAYGLIRAGSVAVLSNTTKVRSLGLVYLNPQNVIENVVYGKGSWNTSDLQLVSTMNVIYSNGGSEVYINRS